MLENPIGDKVEDYLGDGLFNLGIFGNRTDLAGLKQMIEPWQFDNLEILVPSRAKGLLNGGQILAGRDLHILLSVY